MNTSQQQTSSHNSYVVQVGASGELRLLVGDITQIHTDAIVNAANAELLPGGGVCGAIHRAGGPSIGEECRRIRAERGCIPTGQGVATTAGRLSAKFVIHAVGPVWQGGDHGEAELLASCYRESMRIADQLGLRSIAFPAISTGIFGYPLDPAAAVACSTLEASLTSATNLTHLSMVLFDENAFHAFKRALISQ